MVDKGIEAEAPSGNAGPKRRTLLRWLARTPVRTFLLFPLAVIAFELVRRDGDFVVVPWGVPLLVWGYLQYRLVGAYRVHHGGGGPGVDIPPQHLVAQGPYRYVRNPMYLGHLIFMLGLVVTFQSWLALALLAVHAVWFDLRVRADEARLRVQFGKPYLDYEARVKRWIPGLL
ncbi:MAG TPA: isoprenylcysteine carboxylmethyltransferase family protein [Xanthobacteraceae bacterium]|jgi:protein-S-isoprenylcysteine O-methyltransferase Ste14|nr:isoprenylcysteine carboxylmethyltransferase family protein [Xanthobacteraceae bacterium]